VADIILLARVQCQIVEGDNYCGEGDVVEAPIKIAAEEFTFRVEAASDDEPAKRQRLPGVRDRNGTANAPIEGGHVEAHRLVCSPSNSM